MPPWMIQFSDACDVSADSVWVGDTHVGLNVEGGAGCIARKPHSNQHTSPPVQSVTSTFRRGEGGGARSPERVPLCTAPRVPDPGKAAMPPHELTGLPLASFPETEGIFSIPTGHDFFFGLTSRHIRGARRPAPVAVLKPCVLTACCLGPLKDPMGIIASCVNSASLLRGLNRRRGLHTLIWLIPSAIRGGLKAS